MVVVCRDHKLLIDIQWINNKYEYNKTEIKLMYFTFFYSLKVFLIIYIIRLCNFNRTTTLFI